MTGEKKTGDIRPTTNYRAIFKNVGYKNYIAANYRVRVKKKTHTQAKKKDKCVESRNTRRNISKHIFLLSLLMYVCVKCGNIAIEALYPRPARPVMSKPCYWRRIKSIDAEI